jgi:hypothetical protein
MRSSIMRGLALIVAYCLWGSTAAFSGPPYGACNNYVGYACVTPYLYNNNTGQGQGDYPVEVTPQGGSEVTYYTNSTDGSDGYIVLIGSVPSTWLIAPNPDGGCSWTPSYQNWTQNTPYDPNNPGGTVGVPTFTTYC